MNKTRYILRKKNKNYIEQVLLGQLDLQLCFKNRTERIFKNDKILITCKNKYISVLVYDNSYSNRVKEIVNLIS